MRRELLALLARQAARQLSRADQSWADKLRVAVLMREDLKSMRKQQSRDASDTNLQSNHEVRGDL